MYNKNNIFLNIMRGLITMGEVLSINPRNSYNRDLIGTIPIQQSLVDKITQQAISAGNLPKFKEGNRNMYMGNFGAGVIIDGVLHTGHCTFRGIEVYILDTGFVAKYEDTKNVKFYSMRLGAEALRDISNIKYEPLTVLHLLADISLDKNKSFFVKAFKNRVCDILSDNFTLNEVEKSIIKKIRWENPLITD